MKLTKDAIRNMVQEVLTERSEDSMLLSEATFGSVQGRINPEERPERTAQEFIVMSSDRGERSPAENNQMYKEFKNRVKLLATLSPSLLALG